MDGRIAGAQWLQAIETKEFEIGSGNGVAKRIVQSEHTEDSLTLRCISARVL